MNHISQILDVQYKTLLFQKAIPDLKHHFRAYFIYILFITWLVGIGRYWDHPHAQWWQYAGLGSVAYIFVLSAILYVIVLPLRPEKWRYSTVLIFVGLTSLPAILYAIPVERFMSEESALRTNMIFLLIVAVWRVALYFWFLRTAVKLPVGKSVIATLLPITKTVVILSLLGLQHVTFTAMGGLGGPEAAVFLIVGLIVLASIIILPIVLVCYTIASFSKDRNNEKVPTIEISENDLRYLTPAGYIIQIRWEDIERVFLRKIIENKYWVIRTKKKECIIPIILDENNQIKKRLKLFPNFNIQAIDDAFTESQDVLCWEKQATDASASSYS